MLQKSIPFHEASSLSREFLGSDPLVIVSADVLSRQNNCTTQRVSSLGFSKTGSIDSTEGSPVGSTLFDTIQYPSPTILSTPNFNSSHRLFHLGVFRESPLYAASNPGGDSPALFVDGCIAGRKSSSQKGTPPRDKAGVGKT